MDELGETAEIGEPAEGDHYVASQLHARKRREASP
jgi:hypothetical protein